QLTTPSGTKSTTSGADGTYAFAALQAGAYRVTFVVPAGYEPTSALAADRTLSRGQAAGSVDFFARVPPPAPAAQQPLEEPPPDDSQEDVDLLGTGPGTEGDDVLNGTGGADTI